MKKQGQSALEFLMTYGWALLALFVAVGIILWSNIATPERFFPEECTLIPSVECITSKVTTGDITFVVRSGYPEKLEQFQIQIISDTGCNGVAANVSSGLLVGEEEKLILSCGADPVSAQRRYTATLNITYAGAANISRNAYGKLSVGVE